MEKQELPTIAELTNDLDMAWKNDNFNFLLNQNPPEKWVKKHPYIKDYNYVPIDKVEYLLKKLFKLYNGFRAYKTFPKTRKITH